MRKRPRSRAFSCWHDSSAVRATASVCGSAVLLFAPAPVAIAAAGGFAPLAADHRHVFAVAAHRFPALLRDLALHFGVHARESAIAGAAVVVAWVLVRHALHLVRVSG